MEAPLRHRHRLLRPATTTVFVKQARIVLAATVMGNKTVVASISSAKTVHVQNHSVAMELLKREKNVMTATMPTRMAVFMTASKNFVAIASFNPVLVSPATPVPFVSSTATPTQVSAVVQMMTVVFAREFPAHRGKQSNVVQEIQMQSNVRSMPIVKMREQSSVPTIKIAIPTVKTASPHRNSAVITSLRVRKNVMTATMQITTGAPETVSMSSVAMISCSPVLANLAIRVQCAATTIGKIVASMPTADSVIAFPVPV